MKENIETYHFRMVVTSDEGYYNSIMELAREVYKESKEDKLFSKEINARYVLAKKIKDLYEWIIEDKGLFNLNWDLQWLITSSLQKIDYLSIASIFIDTIIEEINLRS